MMAIPVVPRRARYSASDVVLFGTATLIFLLTRNLGLATCRALYDTARHWPDRL
jgi:hypothetical protein